MCESQPVFTEWTFFALQKPLGYNFRTDSVLMQLFPYHLESDDAILICAISLLFISFAFYFPFQRTRVADDNNSNNVVHN